PATTSRSSATTGSPRRWPTSPATPSSTGAAPPPPERSGAGDALAPVAHERDRALVDADVADQVTAQPGDRAGLAGQPGVHAARGGIDRGLVGHLPQHLLGRGVLDVLAGEQQRQVETVDGLDDG